MPNGKEGVPKLVSAVQFWQKIYESDFVYIKFIKKDGSERLMKATLNFKLIPDKDRPKNVNVPRIMKWMQEKGLINVYDLENKGWRSVPFEKVIFLDTPEGRYAVEIEGKPGKNK